jgi:hypothetical protein
MKVRRRVYGFDRSFDSTLSQVSEVVTTSKFLLKKIRSDNLFLRFTLILEKNE